MTTMNLNNIDTTPGANGDNPFCPPAGFEGNSEGYKALLRERWSDIMFGQRMAAIARHAARNTSMVVKGPFALEARTIIDGLMPKKAHK
ncbi:MAG: hypothetical protein HQL38_01545 [Alphaproteobacteria bacterium]|nr:hypothetical protein [Alphaproteobacteria bacterium]